MADRIGIKDLEGRGVVALVSGGLDSVTFTRWARDRGVKVHCCTADLGQPDEQDIGDIETRMRQSGAETFTLVDGRQALAEAGLLLVICGASYEGGYLNTTGIARAVTTQKALPVLAAHAVDVLSHGATGRGNDQTRFQLYANMLDPTVKVYAPWRDPEFLAQFPGRSEMIDRQTLDPIRRRDSGADQRRVLGRGPAVRVAQRRGRRPRRRHRNSRCREPLRGHQIARSV
jgi:argininosuccinate synthase